MLFKQNEFNRAVFLRKQGKSYSEIAQSVSISISTLSGWLRNIPLSKKNRELLLFKKKQGQLKGALKKKNLRIKKEMEIHSMSAKDIRKITKRELFLLGALAYWCEGAKQREGNISQRVVFMNSDPNLVNLFLRWLRDICHVSEDKILYSLYIHETGDQERALEYWAQKLEISRKSFGKVILKKHKIKTIRKNTGLSYFGLVRITVRESTDLNRRIHGWIKGISSSFL